MRMGQITKDRGDAALARGEEHSQRLVDCTALVCEVCGFEEHGVYLPTVVKSCSRCQSSRVEVNEHYHLQVP